jgi:hypothetical protein
MTRALIVTCLICSLLYGILLLYMVTVEHEKRITLLEKQLTQLIGGDRSKKDIERIKLRRIR